MISPTVLAKPEHFLAPASKSSRVACPAAANADMFPGRRGSDVRGAASKPFVSLTTVTLHFLNANSQVLISDLPQRHLNTLCVQWEKSRSSFLGVLLVIFRS